MSYSQEIYDAARSRINPISGEGVESAAREAFDISYVKDLMQQEISAVGAEWQRPSVLFRPTISLDGNCYCALYGEDLMSGCAGFGDTMAAAMVDFDNNWWKQKAPSNASPAKEG